MERQFVASAIIIKNDKILLIYHKKLQKWLAPGGHAESNETPPETACREALEETGLEVKIISQENLWFEGDKTYSIERPYLCLVEEIPAYKDQPRHQHIDMIYLATPISGVEGVNAEETEGLKWFTLEEIEKLRENEEIFSEFKQMICHILSCPEFSMDLVR